MSRKSSVSRRQVAQQVANYLPKQRQRALKLAAAWLVSTKRTRETSYLAKDIAMIELTRGYAWTKLTSAHPVRPNTRKQVEQFVKAHTKARQVELELMIDQSLLGGVKLETATAIFDGTLKTRLNSLAQGVSA